MMQMRTHTCNELRLEHVGQSVKLVGWMENVRAVGQNFAFVVLRDFYGTTQIVVETEDMMAIIRDLNKESTISVEGVVRERASKNPKQATGDIEVVPSKIEVLGRCRYNSLPFEINRSREADEQQRLKYRYLDLRNPAVKQNIILRCQVVAALRAAGVRTQLYTEQKKFKAKMNYADKIGVPYVLFLGDDEIAGNVVGCKDMASGEQTTLPFDETLAIIQKGLAQRSEGKVIVE